MVTLIVADEPWKADHRRRATSPNCYACGRFCNITNDETVLDFDGMQRYVTFDCKHCGVFTESMW